MGGPPCRPDSQPSPDSPYPSHPLPPTPSGKASSTIHSSLCYLLTLPEPKLRTGHSTRYIASPFAEPMLMSLLQGSLTPAVFHHNIEQHAGTTVSVLSPPTTPSTTSSSAMRVWFNLRIQLDFTLTRRDSHSLGVNPAKPSSSAPRSHLNGWHKLIDVRALNPIESIDVCTSSLPGVVLIHGRFWFMNRWFNSRWPNYLNSRVGSIVSIPALAQPR
jgi:hypothetical protein